MINNTAFASRLKKVMDYYQLSSTAFADKIGVQRSSISHLLSGRNKPSLDFVLKVLDEFSTVELYWLLNGKGTFPKAENNLHKEAQTENSTPILSNMAFSSKEVDRIVLFYKDGTFMDYTPTLQKKS